MNTDTHSASDIRKILEQKNIAVVGMSKNEEKPAHFVPKYLIEHGYNVIPVNPTITEVLGRKSYPSIADIPDDVDVVDVFRRSEDALVVVMDAMKKKGIMIMNAAELHAFREAFKNEKLDSLLKALEEVLPERKAAGKSSKIDVVQI